MNSKSGQKKESSGADLVPAVLTADRPVDCAFESREIFENVVDYDISSPPFGVVPARRMVDHRPRDVTFTEEERMHDADVDVLVTYSRSTDTASFKSINSVGSYSLRQLQSEAQLVEPPSDRPLLGGSHLLIDDDGSLLSLLDTLSAADPQYFRSTSVGIRRPQPVCLTTDVVLQDSQLVSDVVTGAVDQYLSCRPLDTALSIRLRPFHSLMAPRLQMCLHPVPMDSSYSTAEDIEDDTTTFEPTETTASNEICCVPLECVPLADNESSAPPKSFALVKLLLGIGRCILELLVGDSLFTEHHRLRRRQLDTDDDRSADRGDNERRRFALASVGETVFLTSPRTVNVLKLKTKQRMIKWQLGRGCPPRAVIGCFSALRHTTAHKTLAELDIPAIKTVLTEDGLTAEKTNSRSSPNSDLMVSIITESDTQTDGGGGPTVILSLVHD